MKILICLGVAILVVLATDLTVSANSADGSTLTLERALILTVENSPHLKAGAQRVSIAENHRRQARLIPNPELEWEGEEISGSRPGFSQSEHSLVLSQTLELGGKRSARTRKAESDIDAARAALESLRLDLQAEVAGRFLEVLVSQRRLALIRESIRLTENLSDAIQRRVDAGAAGSVEALRAHVAVANVRLDSTRAASQWTNAKKQLAALWGEAEPAFDSVAGIIPAPKTVPNAASLLPLVSDTPQLIPWRMAIESSRRDLAVAKSLRVPDVTVSAGPRLTLADGQKSFIFGLSLPLPFFDRSQGEIGAAAQAIALSESELIAAQNEWQANLAAVFAEMNAAYLEATKLVNMILPQAAIVFEEIDRGYREGLFTYLEVLTAEQDLINAREHLLEVEAEYHRHRIEAERLLGRSLQELEESDGQ